MKRHVILSAFFLLIANNFMFCQETKPLKFSMGVSSGYVGNVMTDRLLNYYIYAGHTFLPIILNGSFLNQKNLVIMNFSYYTLKSFPRGLNKAFYEYNYTKTWSLALDIAFYRKIFSGQNSIRIYAGITNNAFTTTHQEFYKNLLYDYAVGYRKSYDLTPINLSPALLISGNVRKSCIRLQAGFSLIKLARRPSDDYVKQLGLSSKRVWKTYFPVDYKNWNLSARYQYPIFKSVDISAEFNILYHSYTSDDYKYLQQAVLLGVVKKF